MIPDDLVRLSDVAARLPGVTTERLLRMRDRGAFPDVMRVGRDLFVRQSDIDVWQRGCWLSVREEREAAARRSLRLPPIRNRRSKAEV